MKVATYLVDRDNRFHFFLALLCSICKLLSFTFWLLTCLSTFTQQHCLVFLQSCSLQDSSGFAKYQCNQFSRMLSYQMLRLDDHLCYFCKASWNFTTESHMSKTPDQTTEDNSPMGIVQFPFLYRRLVKSAFILCFIFINLEHSLVNRFYFLGTEDFRWQKRRKGNST